MVERVLMLEGIHETCDHCRFVALFQEAQAYADENGLLFMETSAKTALNVNETFLAIGKLQKLSLCSCTVIAHRSHLAAWIQLFDDSHSYLTDNVVGLFYCYSTDCLVKSVRNYHIVTKKATF